MLVQATLVLALALGSGERPVQAYARPELLVEAAEVAQQAKAARVRLLDARSNVKYKEGHVPGAVWVDHDAWSKVFADGQDPKDWAARIGELGIDNSTRVIVYDDAMSKNAARIWWMLRYWGVVDARLVNGGFPAYSAAGLPLSQNVPDQGATFNIMREGGRLATREDVLGVLKNKKGQIIDTRSEKEFCGDTRLAKKGGAIPGAVHLEWTEALDPKTQKFKSAAELSKLLKDAGIDLSRPIVAHCQSGGRSSVMAFTLELMGARDVANYYLGWSEWGNRDDTPIVTPAKKK
jgi:thiosulfate/3-mercaptopyruvate sulfurtransferase